MIVFSLKKKNNDVEILFEDGSTIIVDYNVAVSNGIRKNDNLSEEKIKYLLDRSEINKIKKYAFRFLGIRNHSSFEIKLKLLKKNFAKELVDIAVKELIDNAFINDRNYALQYLEEKIAKGKSGPNKIESELIKRGISREIIKEIFTQIDTSYSFETALKLAVKKLKTFKEKDVTKSKQKIFLYLHSKGFDTDVISIVLNKLNYDDD